MKKQFLRARFACMSVLAIVVAASWTQLAAQTNFPVYVSTGAGQQILAFDSNSGAVTGVCNISPAVPEDVVVGPDGNLYVADTSGNRILRVPTPIPGPLSTPASCGAVAVYDKAACTGSCPSGPEGPSFLRIATLDLYFNTHGADATGVWKIPGVANNTATPPASALCNDPGQPACAAPVQVFSGSSGEGVDFDVFGKLLAVDQVNNKVVRASVACLTSTNGCTPDTVISTNLSAPVGIAVNTCGDVLVASGNTVRRYTDTNPAVFSDSRSFGGNNMVRFLEVDSTNRLFVVTSSDESGKGGTFWRLDPPSANPLTTCTLGSFITGLNIPVKTSLAAGIATSNGLGLGLSASNTSLSASFKVHPAVSTNLYVFGAQHSFQVTCNNVLKPFDLKVTALKSRPTDAANAEVTFEGFPQINTQQCPVALMQPECLHYGGHHGFCTQYLEEATDPNNGNAVIPESDLPSFCSAAPHPFTFMLNFSAPEFINDPGVSHTLAPNPAFNECQSQDFYTPVGNTDPMRAVGSNSKHVGLNAGLMFNGALTLNSPISSCLSLTNCNPQFNVGQNISVKFTLLSKDPPFNAITDATEQLSIVRVQHTTKGVVTPEFVPQTIVSTKNSAVLNFFNPNSSGQYSFNDDSSAFDKLPRGTTAVYQYTIWGNGAPPFSFLVSGSF